MINEQWHTIERTLIDLSVPDKLELVERIVHELRVGAASKAQSPAPRVALTEAEFKQQLLSSGLMTSLPTPSDPTSRPAYHPITIEGEPLSETIIRERR